MSETPTLTLLDYAEAIQSCAVEVISRLSPPLIPPGRPRVALYLTIAEQFDAAIRLGRCGAGTHSAVHVRSMVEALVSMNLLATDPRHVDRMRFEKVRGEKRLYESLLSNTDLPNGQRQNLEARLMTCKAEYDALFAKGQRPRPISGDFGTTGLSQFAAPYTVLCGFSHNDLAVIALRHQGDHGMTYRAEVPQEVMHSIFSIGMAVMIAATGPLPDIAMFPEGHFEDLYAEMIAIWETYLKSWPGATHASP